MDLSICIVSWNRPKELGDLLESLEHHVTGCAIREVLILDNGSEPSYNPLPIAQIQGTPISLIRSETNLGCPAGRNLLAHQASSPLILFVDDDAVFKPGSHLDSAIEWLTSDASLMAVTGLVTENNRTRMRTPWRFRKRSLLTEARRPAPGFIGGNVILKREHFLALGGFSDSGRYGGEEALLSIQALLAGRTFAFTSDFELAHEPSPEGRLRTVEVGVANLTNRLVMATYFGHPMRTTLRTSAVLSNIRRGGVTTLRTAFSAVRSSSPAHIDCGLGLIRIRDHKLLRKLGWRAWI